jgi:hypothetical protein
MGAAGRSERDARSVVEETGGAGLEFEEVRQAPARIASKPRVPAFEKPGDIVHATAKIY